MKDVAERVARGFLSGEPVLDSVGEECDVIAHAYLDLVTSLSVWEKHAKALEEENKMLKGKLEAAVQMLAEAERMIPGILTFSGRMALSKPEEH